MKSFNHKFSVGLSPHWKRQRSPAEAAIIQFVEDGECLAYTSLSDGHTTQVRRCTECPWCQAQQYIIVHSLYERTQP